MRKGKVAGVLLRKKSELEKEERKRTTIGFSAVSTQLHSWLMVS